MIVGKARQFGESRRRKRSRAAGISAIVMMAGRGQLDQPLQERFFRLEFSKPELFPYFVCLKKLARIK
jgi:hypothetical protein